MHRSVLPVCAEHDDSDLTSTVPMALHAGEGHGVCHEHGGRAADSQGGWCHCKLDTIAGVNGGWCHSKLDTIAGVSGGWCHCPTPPALAGSSFQADTTPFLPASPKEASHGDSKTTVIHNSSQNNVT
jgi:hypothetical protein